ncbi:hypothetical protein NL108_014431 [Boleophthalmus pectinirostris]|uniref:protein FAM174C n=1 Tax=Boleophthalmus pectinirostris TaxID=150288 RepID=UPI00242AC5E8|nr:protein FAM174C [Boleophthalmus pectinirostris]XP_055021190.1 protein FAM174C [Boleophthalmus pectinirostris]XP_055021191.1 protein FAM174C [Boleophthalmus pectinirostris]XP_055021192.1 protein FAM174C [Boleophthalmus pectinirostris]KAJ0065626.1 hypothetical protein NL108_014431 [Boleophthalmus pectinirostris]
MSFYRLVTTLVLSVCCWMLVLAADGTDPKPVTTAAAAGAAAVPAAPGPSVKPAGNHSTNITSPAVNSTEAGGKRKGTFSANPFSVDGFMIQRALYVLIGITLTGLLYFLIRAVRLKKPAPKKKYGLLSNYDDSVEMEGVESEEDDTLYEARSLRR